RNQSAILVHNTETSSSDLDFIEATNARGISTWFCLCPNANLYINNKLPDIERFASYKNKIILGTDSLASNNNLDILGEIKTMHRFFPSIPVHDLLRWATLNGAKALEIDEQTGSFEAGKQPGIVLIEGLTATSISPEARSYRIL
ncbi:MAG: amidohydrolase, partial [Chitinophagaceae bacterium]